MSDPLSWLETWDFTDRLDLMSRLARGRGLTTVQTVAAGRDTFGLADATTMVVGITNRNVPVRAVSVYSQTGVQGFAYHKSSNWDGKVASIKGKVIISSPGSAELSVFPAVFATAGFKMDDVELRLTDPNAKVPLFIQQLLARFWADTRQATSSESACACRIWALRHSRSLGSTLTVRL